MQLRSCEGVSSSVWRQYGKQQARCSNRIGACVARVHVLVVQMKLSSDIWLIPSAPG